MFPRSGNMHSNLMNNNQSVRARRARREALRSACSQALETLEHRQMLTVNPVIVFEFNEGSGLTTADSSAEGGIMTGDLVASTGGGSLPTWGTATASPSGGSYLSFAGDGTKNGQGGRVDTNSPLSTVLGNTSSLSYWIRTTATGNNTPWDGPAVTGAEQAGAGNDIFLGSLTADGRAKIQAGGGASSVSRPINDGNWHRVVHTYDATSGQVRTYVDGILHSTATTETGPKTAPFNSIGALVNRTGDLVGIDGYNHLNADLDQIEVFDRVLSPEEVAVRYGPTAAGAPAAPTVTATSEALRSITLTWNDVADAQGYRVYRSTTGAAGSFTEVGLVPADATNGPTTRFRQTGLTAGQAYYYEVVAFGQGGVSDAGSANLVAPATGNGLSAHYYTSGFWGNSLRPGAPASPHDNTRIMAGPAQQHTLIGQELDFNWGGGSPAAGIPTDNFSTAFTGEIVAPETGDYYILGYGDDDTSVFVNGALVSYDPLGHGIPGNNQGGFDSIDLKQVVTLTAGQSYDVVVLQAEQGGGAGVQLRWITPTMMGATGTASSELVPVTSLRTATGAPAAATDVSLSHIGDRIGINFTDRATNELQYVVERSFNGGAFIRLSTLPIIHNGTDGSPGFGYVESPISDAGTYAYRIRAINFDGESVSTTQTITVADDPVEGARGLQGYYFNSQFWGSNTRPPDSQIIVGLTPDFSESVGNVAFNWGDGNNGTPASPEPGVIRGDNFSTVFTGKFVAPETGTYSILAFSDDDSYVWVDGKLVSGDPGGHGIPGNNAAGLNDINIKNTINLTAGQEYNIVAIQSEGGGGAGIFLRWILPSDTDKTNADDIPLSAFVSDIPNAGTGALSTGAPAAATNLRAPENDRQGTFLTLQWDDVATNELVYTVERTGPGGVVTTFNVPINATSFIDTTLTANTQYTYRLIASNFHGTTASAPLTVTTRVANEPPAAPSNAVAVSRGTGVRVYFNDNSTTENQFIIERATVTGGVVGAFGNVGTFPGTATSVSGGRFGFTDTTAVEGTTYVYRVVAANAAGNSAATNEVQITYTKPTGTGVRATYYPTINFQGDPIVLANPIDLDEDWGDNGPAELVADAGDTDADDTISTRFEGYITPEFTEAYTFWTASDDGIALQIVDPVTGQVLINSDNLGQRRGLAANGGFSDNAGTVNLVAGKKYAIIVRVVEDQGGFGYRVGWSSASLPQEVIATELLVAPSNTDALVAPRAISAVAVGSEKVTVTFDGNLANFTETGFEVLRSNTGAPGTFSVVGTAGVNANQFVDTTGLVAGQTYYYMVHAVNGATPGPDSNVVSASTTIGGTGITLGGTAAILPGGELQITDNVNDRIGTAFTSNAQVINQAGKGTNGSNGFSTSFNFTLPEGSTNTDGTPNMADGFAFVIQRNSPTAVGGGGGSLGYVGMPNSVAVEFDFYNAVNQVGVYANGFDLGNDVAGNSTETGLTFENGHTYKVDIGYNAETNEMRIVLTDLTDTGVTPIELIYSTARTGTAAAPADETLNITQLTGGQQAFFGFTGATGGLNADQRITNWTLNGVTIPLVVTENQWTGGVGGAGTDATVGSNWSAGQAPNGPTSTAKFGNADPNAGDVTINVPANIGTVIFDSSNPYNLQGTGTITLGGVGSVGTINVVNGTHTVGNPIVAPGGVNVTLGATAGGLTLGNVDGDVTVTGDGKTLNTGAVTNGSLTVNSGATVKTSGTSVLDALTLSGAEDNWTSRLDIGTGGLIIRSTAATREADLARVRNMIEQGLNVNGTFWGGNGIMSSTAASTSGGTLTAVGAILNDYAEAGLPSGPIYTEFNGVAVTENDILVKYTYFGDADLNGVVDGTDYFLIDNAFSAGTVDGGWLNGDFDYNGAVDGTDYFLIDNAFSAQGEPLSGGAAASAASVETAPAASSDSSAKPVASTSSGNDIGTVFSSNQAISGQAATEEADEDDDSVVASSEFVL